MALKSEDRLPVEYRGFLYRKTSKALIINSTDFENAVKVMKEDNISNLEINSNFLRVHDLSFLNKFTFISGLSLISPLIKDISLIHLIPNLKVLNIEHRLSGKIDFKTFTNLTDCFFIWGIDGSETIFDCFSLQNLRIDNYNRFEVMELSNLITLKYLSLYHSSIANLSGIGKLKKLVKLDLTGCKFLEDIETVNELFELEELRLDECKNLVTIEPVQYLPKLKSLSFNNIGNLSSIKYLISLKKLEEIFFSDNTNILDGDLNSLQTLHRQGHLKKVIFKYRKHYTHKPQELGYKVPDVVANIFRKK